LTFVSIRTVIEKFFFVVVFFNFDFLLIIFDQSIEQSNSIFFPILKKQKTYIQNSFPSGFVLPLTRRSSIGIAK